MIDENEIHVDDAENVSKVSENKSVDSDFLSLLSEEEMQYVDSMREQDGLVVSMRVSGPVYRVGDDGEIGGFHYNMASLFAQYLELPLKVELMNFEDYFKVDGEIPKDVKTDETIMYTPDVLEKSHVIADSLTVLDWRKRLMDFVEFVPVGIVIMTSDNFVVESIDDLKGLTIAIEQNTSYFSVMNRLNKENDLDLNFIYVKSGEIALEYMLVGKCDFTVKDSNSALYESRLNDRFKVSIPISEPEYIGWAIEKDNTIFKSIATKFIKYTLESGELDILWEEDYGVSLREYSEILGVMDYK